MNRVFSSCRRAHARSVGRTDASMPRLVATRWDARPRRTSRMGRYRYTRCPMAPLMSMSIDNATVATKLAKIERKKRLFMIPAPDCVDQLVRYSRTMVRAR